MATCAVAGAKICGEEGAEGPNAVLIRPKILKDLSVCGVSVRYGIGTGPISEAHIRIVRVCHEVRR